MSYTEKNAGDANESLESKITTLTTFLDAHTTGMLTTQRKDGQLVARAMNIAAREKTVDLIFHTHADSGKTDELEENSKVGVSFYKDSTGEWVSVSGTAELVTDRAVVEKYYSPSLKAWMGDKGDGVHDGGPQDPRIGIIRIKVAVLSYSLQTATQIGKTFQIAKGMVTGDVPKIHEIVHLSEADINAARK